MSVATAIAFLPRAALDDACEPRLPARARRRRALPALSLRRPLQSLRLLLTDRSWLLGFAMEGGGFALYAAALALAPLALVQSVAAGGIGLLAFLSVRLSGGPRSARAGSSA